MRTGGTLILGNLHMTSDAPHLSLKVRQPCWTVGFRHGLVFLRGGEHRHLNMEMVWKCEFTKDLEATLCSDPRGPSTWGNDGAQAFFKFLLDLKFSFQDSIFTKDSWTLMFNSPVVPAIISTRSAAECERSRGCGAPWPFSGGFLGPSRHQIQNSFPGFLGSGPNHQTKQPVGR